MNDPIYLILMFGLGMALQAMNLLKDEVNKGKLLIPFLVGFAGFVPGKHESGYNFNSHLFAYFIVFAFCFAILFRDKILSKIDENTVLFFTMAFWYVLISKFGLGIFSSWTIFLLIPFSVFAFLDAFINWVIPYVLKVLLYIWFLLMNFVLLVIYFVLPLWGYFFAVKGLLPVVSPLDALLYGGVSLYLIGNFFYLFLIIPIPGKHQAFKDRIREWKQYIHVLADKYDDYQLKIWEALFIFLFFGSIFVMNYFYHFVSDMILINASLICFSLFDSIMKPKTLSQKNRKLLK